MPHNQTRTAVGLIGFAVLMNIPFALLGASFDYPDILRRPAPEILSRFAAGGAPLILTWQLYVLVCVGMLPLAFALRNAIAARYGERYDAATALACAAAVTQAIGLSRWVFAVPGLAATALDPHAGAASQAAALVVFQTLHQFAGAGIGENLGQTFTALWALAIGLPSLARGRWVTGGLAALAGGLILAGTAEGYATVIAFDPGPLSLCAPLGYVLLSAWLVALGVRFLRRA